VCDIDGLPLTGYGMWDVRTIDGGIVYVYLPAGPGIEANWVRAAGTFYGATYAHTVGDGNSHVLTETSWPPAPTVSSVTARRVVLAPILGAEYAVNQTQSWQSSPTFAALTPDTEYVFYARYAATGSVPASFVSPSVTVRTARTAALEAAIAAASPLRQADYTPGSWAVLQVLLGQAVTALAEDSAGQAQIDAMTEALVAAEEAVVPRGNTSGLASVVNAAEGLVRSDYTPESWSVFADALEAATAILSDPARLVETGQDEVDALMTALADAIEGLTVLPAETSVLAALVDAADSYTSGGYTAASWSRFDDARSAARALIDDDGALVSQIEAAAADLEAATAGLVRVVGTDVLDGAIASARAAMAGVAPADYTMASWGALVASLARAESVAESASVDQTSQLAAEAAQRAVDAAAGDLASALTGLVVDKTGLNAAIAAVESAALKPADYTPESWSALTSALTQARAVHGDDDATPASVRAAADTLHGALVGLARVLNTGGLAAGIDAVGALEASEALFTPESWAAFSQALAEARRTLAAPSSQSALDAAAARLAQAVSDLVPVEPAAEVRGGLDNTISVARDLTQGDYTPESWQALMEALANAEALARDPAATAAQLAAAQRALTAALAGLRQIATVPTTPTDRTTPTTPTDPLGLGTLDTAIAGTPTLVLASAALTDLIARAEAARQAEYTPEAWVSLAAALASAKAALSDPGATVGSLGQAIAWLSIAMAARSAPTPAPGNSANQQVTVVKAAQSKVRLVKGKSITFAAFGYMTGGGRAKVTWKSSKTAVAKVSASGRITARKAGKATVTASAGGKKATITVTVLARRPAAAKAKVKTITATVPKAMAVGKATSVRPSYKPVTATSVKVTYSSSKPAVATIDKAGRLTAKAAGTATITIKAGTKSKKYKVRVA
jgi:hypothetical protein